MGSSLKSNPVFQRIKSTSRGPSISTLVWCGLGSIIIVALINYYLLLYVIKSPAKFAILTYLVAPFPFSFFLPLLFGALSASFFTRESQEEAFRLLNLTLVSKSQLLAGYIFSFLYRYRILIIGIIIWIVLQSIFLIPYAFLEQIFHTNCQDRLKSCMYIVQPAAMYTVWTAMTTMVYFFLASFSTIPVSFYIAVQDREWFGIVLTEFYALVLMIAFFAFATSAYIIDYVWVNGQYRVEFIRSYPVVYSLFFVLPVLLSLLFYRLTLNHLRTAGK